MTDFERLYERYARDVYRFALYLSGSPARAEDIASETFVWVWTTRDAIRVASVKAYLFTMIVNSLALLVTWFLRLGLPLALLLIPLGFLFRRHIKVPRFLKSGTVLAIVTGVVLVLAQLGWLALLNDASVAMEEPYRALMTARP